MKSIQPIETRFAGRRFRSRTEARWAVAFSELGIAWDYELEGYSLPNGVWYLPDFWLRDFMAHAEVKPTLDDDALDAKKILGLALHQPETVVFLFVGTPGSHRIFKIDHNDVKDYLKFEHAYGDRTWSIRHFVSIMQKWCEAFFDQDDKIRWVLRTFDDIAWAQSEWKRAMEAAKGARFEFGEEG